MSLPDLYSVVPNILGLVSPESYRVSYPVTSPHQEKKVIRERVWGSPDVGRAPGCVRTQGTLPGSIWKRGMWQGIAKQVRTHRTHGTKEMRRLRQDATPTDQIQGSFLLMCMSFDATETYLIALGS